jgi:hypothetical protein
MNTELLRKFSNTPGLCSIDEVLQVRDFFVEVNEMVGLFREAFGYDPIGNILQTKIISLTLYLLDVTHVDPI